MSELMKYQGNASDNYLPGQRIPNGKYDQSEKGIMETICCEVIGCKASANWLFVSPPNGSREVYLCDDCRHSLHQRQPDKASLYIQMDELCETVVDSILLKAHKDNGDCLSLIQD